MYKVYEIVDGNGEKHYVVGRPFLFFFTRLSSYQYSFTREGRDAAQSWATAQNKHKKGESRRVVREVIE